MELYRKVRLARSEGMSQRQCAFHFGISRDMIRKMDKHSVPPGYRRVKPIHQPKLGPFTGIIDAWLEQDKSVHHKQCHTAQRIFERLRDEHHFDGGITIVKDYVRKHKRDRREMFVPLSHAPGHAQADFGEADAIIGGVKRRLYYFCLDLPHSDACFVKAYEAATSEAWMDGHVSAFSFFGGVPLSILYDNDRCLVSKILPDGTRQRSKLLSGCQSHYLFHDRLTRSLADFAQLVELLDKHQVSFVSVTQQFNTTSSMGRLTLNVLLSFAQFEREVTAERIRDKVAASKQKGMWMVGVCPVGYKPNGRTLEIDAKQAKVVRDLFSRYERLKSVPALVTELKAEGIKSPRRPLLTGRLVGGGYFEKGHLYNLLKNPIYVGKIRHKGKVYDGEHEGIICQDQFDRIQQIFASQTRRKRNQNSATAARVYRGRVFDEDGQRMLNSSTVKGGKQYRYYVSSKTSAEGQKVSAAELERAIAEAIAKLKDDPGKLEMPGANAREIEQIAKALDPFKAIRRIDLKSDGQGRLTLSEPANLEIEFNFRPATNSRKGRVAKSSSICDGQEPETAYQIHLKSAFRIWDAWKDQPKLSSAELAKKLQMDRSRMMRVLRLRFLCPKVMQDILPGKILSVGAEDLIKTPPPEDWQEQEKWLLAA